MSRTNVDTAVLLWLSGIRVDGQRFWLIQLLLDLSKRGVEVGGCGVDNGSGFGKILIYEGKSGYGV